MEWLRADTWSPYVVGIGIGVLSWFTFLLSDNTLGCSTSFSRFGGMIEKIFSPGAVAENEYYKKTAPIVDWQVMLVVGILIGSFLSAALSGYLRWEMLPSLWAAHFGEGSSLLRFFVALLGGIFMGIGSRWSNGCTSGHGISGTLQMALSGWISTAAFFLAGIIVAYLLYS